MTATDTRLLRSSSVMAVGTLLSRVLGFVRSAVFVVALGSQLTSDTYTVANTVPNIVYILLAGGAINTVFVPQLVRAMKEHRDGGQAYADGLLSVTAAALLVITVAATLCAPLLVRLYSGHDWTSADRAVATGFAFWCLPQIFFYGVYTMLGQVLNARARFGPMMWSPILNNIVAIATAVVFLVIGTVDPRHPSSLSTGEIALLGGGTTLGVAVQAVALVPFLRVAGYRFRLRWDVRGLGLRTAGRLAQWTLLFVAANQVAFLVVTRIATGLARQAVTAHLGYGIGLTPYTNAQLFFMLPHSIVTVSIVTALLPRMSASAVDGRHDEVVNDLSRGWRLSAVAIVPSAVFLALFGRPLLTVLFAYGQTTTRDARLMALVLAGFAVGLVPFTVHYLTLRGFYAYDDTRTPFLVQTVIAVVNIVLAVAAARLLPLSARTPGLALAYSAAFLVGAAVSVQTLRHRLHARTGRPVGIDGFRVVRTHVRLTVAAAVSGAVAWAAARGVEATLGLGRVASAVELLVAVVIMGGGFLALARRMRIDEVIGLLATVLGRPA